MICSGAEAADCFAMAAFGISSLMFLIIIGGVVFIVFMKMFKDM